MGSARKSAKPANPAAAQKPCRGQQQTTRKPFAHKPAAVHKDYHISGLPKTIAEATKLDWTFELISDTNGKRACDTVTMKGFSSNKMASKMFQERLVDTPFYMAKTIAEAIKLGWTFRLAENNVGKGRLDSVEVKFTSPSGMVSKTFQVIFGATPFYARPAVAPVTQEVPHRKLGLTPVEQAQRKAAKMAEARALRNSMKGTGGSKPQQSSSKKPKGKR